MKHKSDRLTIYLLGYAYAFIMLLLMTTVIYKSIPLPTLLIISAFGYLFVNLVLSFKVTRIISYAVITLAGIATGILFLTHHDQFIIKQWNGVMLLCDKIYYNELINTPELITSSLLLTNLSSIAASVIIFVLFNKFFRFFLLTASAIALQIFAWFVTGKENKLILAVFCLLTVIAYFRHVYEKKIKMGLITDRKVSGSIMLFSIPAAIIPIIIIMLMPKNDLPIQVPWLDQKIMSAIQYLEQRFSYSNIEFFSLSTTGFNGFSERLGGPVRPSNTIVMDVKGDNRTYLRGAAYTWYENNSWLLERNADQAVDSSGENDMEIQENKNGWRYIPVEALFPNVNPDDVGLLKSLGTDEMRSLLFPTYSIEVSYRNMTTHSMFSPLLTIMPVKDTNGSIFPVNENLHGIFVGLDRLKSGTKYKVDYVQPMYGDPMLMQALTFSSSSLYQDALDELNRQRSEILRSNGLFGNFYMAAATSEKSVGTDTEKTTRINDLANAYGVNALDYYKMKELDDSITNLTSLNDWAKRTETDYTKITDTIPVRVKDLAISITKDCKNDYEKLLAIQKYLNDNCSYTLNASRIPEGQDFVDWFLFKDHKGYCTYFATAMTLMLRYNNIPARYVEGYVMPDQPDENSVYTISNRYAHAWVEAYFEGFGWLTFEPTQIYSNVMNYKVVTGAATGSSDFGMSPNYEEMMAQFRNRSDIPGYIPESISNRDGAGLSAYLKYIPHALAGLIVLLILINLMAIVVSNLLLLKLKSKRKILRYYQMMFKWLENSDYAVKPGETVLEFARRIDEYFIFNDHNFTETTKIFSKVRYGDKDVTTDEIVIVKNTANQLKESILRDFGIRRFIPLRRIILGI